MTRQTVSKPLSLPPQSNLPSVELVRDLPVKRSLKDLSAQDARLVRRFHEQILETEAEREKAKFGEAALGDLTVFTHAVYRRTVMGLDQQIQEAEGTDYYPHVKQFGEYLMELSAKEYLGLREIAVQYIAKVAAEDVRPEPLPPPRTVPTQPTRNFAQRLGYLFSGR